MTNLPTKLAVEGLLANPAVTVYIDENGFGYMMYRGLETPALIGAQESMYLQDALAIGTAVKVLEPIYESEQFPLGTLVAVVSTQYMPTANKLFCKDLSAQGYSLNAQAFLKALDYHKEDYTPATKVFATENNAQTADFLWGAFGIEGDVQLSALSDAESQGLKELIGSGKLSIQFERPIGIETPCYIAQIEK